MNQNDLRPAGDFARMFGVKSLVYGPPGSGKTPLLNTAPRPVLLACESGMLSMRGSQVPTWQTGDNPARIDEFFKWFMDSKEAKNFDTLGIDSVAEMASIYLRDAKHRYADGRKQYGIMYDKVTAHLTNVYYMPQKHVYAICKQGRVEGGAGVMPLFPGQALNSEIPHQYDFILHLDIKNIPNAGQHKAFQTQTSIDVMARHRTGNLDFFEPPDLSKLFAKAMA
jgi:hypothetical protein